MNRVVALVSLSAMACAAQAPPPSSGGVALQGLAPQGMDTGDQLWDELAQHPLSQETFDKVTALATAIRRPAVLAAMVYVARGALSSGQQLVLVVDGEEHVFEGSLGLAPQWTDEL